MRHMTQRIGSSCSWWYLGTSTEKKEKALQCSSPVFTVPVETNKYLVRDCFIFFFHLLIWVLLSLSLLLLDKHFQRKTLSEFFFFFSYAIYNSVFVCCRGLGSGCEKIISIIPVLFIPVRKESSYSGQTMVRYGHCSSVFSPVCHSVEKKLLSLQRGHRGN